MVSDGTWRAVDRSWWMVGDDGWRVTDGGWRVPDDSWWVTDGSWGVTDANRGPANVWWCEGTWQQHLSPKLYFSPAAVSYGSTAVPSSSNASMSTIMPVNHVASVTVESVSKY